MLGYDSPAVFTRLGFFCVCKKPRRCVRAPGLAFAHSNKELHDATPPPQKLVTQRRRSNLLVLAVVVLSLLVARVLHIHKTDGRLEIVVETARIQTAVQHFWARCRTWLSKPHLSRKSQ